MDNAGVNIISKILTHFGFSPHYYNRSSS